MAVVKSVVRADAATVMRVFVFEMIYTYMSVDRPDSSCAPVLQCSDPMGHLPGRLATTGSRSTDATRGQSPATTAVTETDDTPLNTFPTRPTGHSDQCPGNCHTDPRYVQSGPHSISFGSCYD